jgi:transcriptional regulator with XRE-family HTH domain
VRRELLKQKRKELGKSQAAVAEEVGVNRQAVGEWERGDSTPHPYQRQSYAAALEVTLSELASMLSSMPIDAGEMPGWLQQYLNMEQSATSIRVHEPKLVDGLLQSPAYVEAVVRSLGMAGVTDDYVLQNVNQRRQRQKRVREGHATLEVIQAEQVLHVQLGSPEVMAEQLRTLASDAELPNVTVRIMPFSAGQYEARRLDAFSILSHPWGNPTACLAGYGGTRFISEVDEVSYIVQAYEHALSLTLSPSDSIDLIREMADTWEGRQ